MKRFRFFRCVSSGRINTINFSFKQRCEVTNVIFFISSRSCLLLTAIFRILMSAELALDLLQHFFRNSQVCVQFDNACSITSSRFSFLPWLALPVSAFFQFRNHERSPLKSNYLPCLYNFKFFFLLLSQIKVPVLHPPGRRSGKQTERTCYQRTVSLALVQVLVPERVRKLFAVGFRQHSFLHPRNIYPVWKN